MQSLPYSPNRATSANANNRNEAMLGHFETSISDPQDNSPRIVRCKPQETTSRNKLEYSHAITTRKGYIRGGTSKTLTSDIASPVSSSFTTSTSHSIPSSATNGRSTARSEYRRLLRQLLEFIIAVRRSPSQCMSQVHEEVLEAANVPRASSRATQFTELGLELQRSKSKE